MYSGLLWTYKKYTLFKKKLAAEASLWPACLNKYLDT